MEQTFSNLKFFPAVSLVLTNACRMNCKFCCAKTEFQMQSRSNLKLFEIVDVLKNNGVKRICFSGGEPLLYNKLTKLAEYCHNNGIENTLMTSDGKLLNELNVNPKHFSKIWLSIHGYGKTHDDITGVNGSFNDLVIAMQNKVNTYPLGVWCVITNTNKADIDSLLKLCIKNNVKNFYLSNVSTVGLGDDYIKENNLITPAEFNLILQDIKQKYGDLITIKGQGFEQDAQCIIVESNGDVIASPYSSEPTNQKIIGNVLLQNPCDIFNNFKLDTKVWTGYKEKLKTSSLYTKQN